MTKLLAPALAALVLALPGAGQAQVKIGFINSITGPEAPIGENLTNGVDLAVEDLKKKGVNVTARPAGRHRQAADRHERHGAARHRRRGRGGGRPLHLGVSNAVAKLAQQYKVPQIVPAAAKEEITRQGYKYVFRLNAPGAPVRAVAHRRAPSRSASRRPSPSSTSPPTSAPRSPTAGKEYAQKKGLQIVADEAYQKGAPDYRSTLTKIKAENPDLVFMVSYVADAILLMRQSREVGLKPQAFLGGGAGFDTAQFESEKDISTNVFSVTQWTPESSPGATEFATATRPSSARSPPTTRPAPTRR